MTIVRLSWLGLLSLGCRATNPGVPPVELSLQPAETSLVTPAPNETLASCQGRLAECPDPVTVLGLGFFPEAAADWVSNNPQDARAYAEATLGCNDGDLSACLALLQLLPGVLFADKDDDSEFEVGVYSFEDDLFFGHRASPEQSGPDTSISARELATGRALLIACERGHAA